MLKCFVQIIQTEKQPVNLYAYYNNIFASSVCALPVKQRLTGSCIPSLQYATAQHPEFDRAVFCLDVASLNHTLSFTWLPTPPPQPCHL